MPATYSKNYFQSARMLKIDHSATNCAYFSKDVHMQEFAFDTICVCTCGYACSEHACFERLSGCPTSACTYALAKCSTYGSLDPRLVRPCEVLKSTNLADPATLAKVGDSGDSGDFWVGPWIWPESGLDARSGQIWPNRGFGRIWPDLLSGPTFQDFADLANFGQSCRICQKVRKLGSDPDFMGPGCYI